MKKQSLLLGAMCVLMFSMSACSNEEELQVSVFTEEVNEITMTATDFEYPTTRTDFEIGSSGAAFKWAKNDTVGIFPNEGSQVYFPMTSGAGTNSASFTGGGWALKSSATYAAYYPFIGDMYLDQKKIPVSYTGQTQTGNGSTVHLGAYDFMAASATTAVNGGVNFNFKHLGCLVQLKITVPVVQTLPSVILSADEEVFVEEGYIDLTTESPAIVPTKTTKTLNIELKNVTTTSTNEVVTVYFMMAPVDMTGKNITATVGRIKGIVEAKKFEGGKAYQLTTSLPSAVDLGLSVKWASCNVGAATPEEYGDYFAWGETKPKEYYAEQNSFTWQYSYTNSLCDYRSSYYYSWQCYSLKSGYDAATLNWGNNWRMPTGLEVQELVEKCTWTYTTQNGVNGCLVTGTNGNSIFLPAAGYRTYSLEPEDPAYYIGKSGYYWSASPGGDQNDQDIKTKNEYAFQLSVFSPSQYEPDVVCRATSGRRYEGISVRPVQK